MIADFLQKISFSVPHRVVIQMNLSHPSPKPQDPICFSALQCYFLLVSEFF